MMVVRATSDLHLAQRTARWVFEALDALREDADAHGGITVLVGDILDQAETVHMPTWNRLRDTLQAFRGRVIVAAGNHDQYDGQRNALEALGSASVDVVSDARITGVGLVIPYVPPGEFWETVKAARQSWEGDPAVANTWWTHQGWRGSYLNSMRRNTDGLSCRRIEAKIVISGHYHMPQNLGPIIYCGSPWETSFAEEGQVKGWLRWEAFDPTDPAVPARIPFDLTAPRHHTVLWDLKNGDKPEKPSSYRDGDRVRIVVNGTREDVKRHGVDIADAGLSGAAIVAYPTASRRGVIDRHAGKADALNQYIDRVYGPEPGMTPLALQEWASEVGLWSESIE